MKQIKSLIAVAVLGLASTAVNAQNLKSGYFSDGYLYRHSLNPAFASRQSYVAMPGIGNLNVTMNSNIRVDKIFYNVDGKTALFFHPKVDAGSFLSSIHDKNRISVDLHEQLLGFGFKGIGGFNTIEINARANVGVNIPGSLFRLAKQGIENKTYDISDFAAHADAYGEIALGHSHQINEKLRIGAKMKFLLGVANIDADFKKAQLTLGEDEWVGVTNAEIQTSLKKMAYKIEETERGPEGDEHTHRYVSGVENSKWGINGFGLAFDLGATYKLDDNWSFSAALLDLGYIGWNNNYVASTNGDKAIHTSTYIFNVDDEARNSFEDESKRLTEGLSELYELDDMGNKGSRSRGLAPTMNLGVEYTPDFYRKMSFGLMNNSRMGKYGWTEFRLSTNVAPTNIFSATANLAFGTYGFSFGWLLNFHPNGFNMFLGMDHTLSKLAKQGAPLSGRGNVNVGINIPFGDNKTKKTD
jgi:hypothetical protein